MAETASSISTSSLSLKRFRDETQGGEDETKRHKSSYNQILSFLEEEEDEPNQDLSSLITSLQQEISSEEPSSESPQLLSESDPLNANSNIFTTNNNSCNNSNSSTPTPSLQGSSSFKDSSEEDEEDKEKVIRHLLEASDDELGIPNSNDVLGSGNGFNGGGGFEFSLCDGLWEFEDETANYYTLLQSELFL